MGNSHYNGLELTLKRTTGPLSLLASYTYSKSYDQTSSIQEQVDPYDYHRLDGISAFDLKHNFVVSYNYDLPVAHLWRPNLTLHQFLGSVCLTFRAVPRRCSELPHDNLAIQR
jgi:hypothetical protein